MDIDIQPLPLEWCSSGDLTALAAANALLHLPAGRHVFSAGAEVAFAPTLPTS